MDKPDLYPVDYGAVTPAGHCGVLATAILAGRTFAETWEAFRKHLRATARWTGGTRHHDRVAVLRAFNVPVRATLHLPRGDWLFFNRKSPDRSYDAALPRCSVATFAARYARPGVTYMLRVSRHVVTLRDGILIDQTCAAPVGQHPERKRIVTVSIERIEA